MLKKILLIIDTIIMIALLLMYYIDMTTQRNIMTELERCEKEKRNIIDYCFNHTKPIFSEDI